MDTVDAPNAPTRQDKDAKPHRWRRVRHILFTYVIGVGAASLSAAYGIIALISGRTFLPGQAGGDHFIHGPPGQILAASYLSGGLFLILRLFVEFLYRDDETRRNRLYIVESGLLIVLIATLIYVLVNVGEVK